MDLTVAATPGYFGTMALEAAYLRRRAEAHGPSPADYERRDTIASLSMGVASLVAPIVLQKLLKPVTPGKGRFGKALLATALGAVAVTTVADLVARREAADEEAGDRNRQNREMRRGRVARKVAKVAGVASVVAGGIAITSTFASRTTPDRMWKHRVVRDLGTGPVALAGAVLAWDFIYYWNHRFMHESRYMWAIHVVHHSSERYNLSTALRQPVADAFGTFLPYSALALVGFQPGVIASARGINLLYQYWIHTDTIRSLGPFEQVLNTPSHHRVHHGSNRQYLDRNHGSILIVWDRLFGTYEREDEAVVYGLTKNIETFDPVRIMTHEHTDMLRDVARVNDLARAVVLCPARSRLGVRAASGALRARHAGRPGSRRSRVTDPSLGRAARLAGIATRRLQQRTRQLYEGSPIAGLRVAESVNRLLDGVFDEPFDVPDAQTAQHMIVSVAAPPASTAARRLEQQAMTRLTPWITRTIEGTKAAGSTSAAGATPRWAAAAANAVVSSATRGRKASADGWNQLRVLASYLVARARGAGGELDQALVRAADRLDLSRPPEEGRPRLPGVAGRRCGRCPVGPGCHVAAERSGAPRARPCARGCRRTP